MRNIPLAFVDERTLDYIRDVEDRRRIQENLNAIHVPRQTIAEHLPEIEQHKWFLGERLGRDVGTEVAAVDYFQNIASSQSETVSIPTKLKNALRSVWTTLADNVTWDGPNSIANLERAMSRHRSSPLAN